MADSTNDLASNFSSASVESEAPSASVEGLPPPPPMTPVHDDVTYDSGQSGAGTVASRDQSAEARHPPAPGRQSSTVHSKPVKPLGSSQHPGTTLESVEDWLGGSDTMDTGHSPLVATRASSTPEEVDPSSATLLIGETNSASRHKDTSSSEDVSYPVNGENTSTWAGSDVAHQEEVVDQLVEMRNGDVNEDDLTNGANNNSSSSDGAKSTSADAVPGSKPETVSVGEREYELMLMRKLVREIISDHYKSANWPFLDPVDVEALKLWDYPERVKNPMWLKKSKSSFFSSLDRRPFSDSRKRFWPLIIRLLSSF